MPHIPAPIPHVPQTTPRLQLTPLLKTQPKMALDLLHQQGNLLPRAEQVQLARLAVGELALCAQGNPNPKSLLPEVQQARLHVRQLDPQAERVLRGVQFRLERRVLAEELTTVARLAQEGNWSAAGRNAQVQVQQPSTPPQTKAALEQVVQVGKQLDAVRNLQAALKANGQPPAEVARKFGQVDLGQLPAKLRPAVRGLKGLAELQAYAGGHKPGPPDAAALKRSVDDLREGLGQDDLVDRIRRDLALKTWLEGHGFEARALLPAEGEGDLQRNAGICRDLKALVLGEGEVHTLPARQALGPKANEPPPGPRLLQPEGEVRGWRPRVPEAAGADVPPLQEAAGAEPRLRQEVAAGAGKHQQTVVQHVIQHGPVVFQQLQAQQTLLRQQDNDERKALADLEARLGRRLHAAEQALAAELRRQGQKAEQVAADLGRAELLAGLEWEAAMAAQSLADLQRLRLARLAGAVAAGGTLPPGFSTVTGVVAGLRK
jgi:peptidoglycan hydrolase-like protein with peptidoglycan-binding domain